MKYESKFSHVPNFTYYMEVAVKIANFFFNGDLANKKILNIPAGNRLVSSELKKLGSIMTSAHINDEPYHYIQANMEDPLPFDNGFFDTVICLEGIEHTLHSERLFSELARALKKGGLLIISTPNVQNFYSRYQLLCTGYLFQFDPFDKTPLNKGQIGDKGHISPVFNTQLIYYADLHNLRALKPSGGWLKRIAAIPFFFPFILIVYWWSVRDWQRTSNNKVKFEIINHLFSIKLLFSRSLVFKAVKNL